MRRGWIALVVSILLLVGGCGGDGPGAEPTSGPASAPTIMPPGGPSPSAPAPTALPAAPPPSSGWTVYLGVNDVQGLAFAPDGSLWAATSGGVAHWNLSDDSYVQYTTADGLASDYVTAVSATPPLPGGTEGALWFATLGGVSRWQDGAWTSYSEADGLIDDAVQSIAVTPSGEVWAGAIEGVSHFDGKVWTSHLAGTRAWSVAVAPDGSVWFANHGAGVSRYSPADDAWTTYTEAGDLPLRGITELTVGPDGDVWAYENWEGVYRFDGERWREAQDHAALVCAIAVAAGGTPWIGTCGSMHSRFGNLIHGQGEGWTEVEGWHELGKPAIQAIAFGPEGTIAVGTEKGLAVYQDGAWRTLRGGPTRNRVTTVAVQAASPGDTGETAWLGFGDDQFSAAGGGASRFDGQAWHYYLGDANVRVLEVAPDGRLWAGVDCGVQRFDGSTWEVRASCDDLPIGNVLDLAFGPGGNVWVAKGMSLARFDGRVWEDMGKMVSSVAAAPDGTVWASGWDGTQDSHYVARFDGSEWEKVSAGGIASLAVTPDGSVWGIGGEWGLVRFRSGAWEQVSGGDGEPAFGSLVVAPTGGALWINGQTGLARLDNGLWTVYPGARDTRDMAVGPDGTIWLATANGAIRFEPTGVYP